MVELGFWKNRLARGEPGRWGFRIARCSIGCTLCLCLMDCSKRAPVRPTAEILAAAWNDLSSGEFERAQVGFDRVKSIASTEHDNARALQADYGLASLAATGPRPDPVAARALYQEIIATDPSGAWAQWAALAIARLSQVNTDPDAVLDVESQENAYQSVIDHYPKTAAADEAFNFMQALRLTTGTEADARRVIDETAQRLTQPDAHTAGVLHNLRAHAYRILKRFPESLQEAIAAVRQREIDPDNPSLDDAGAIYNIGVAAQFDVGDFETASRFYNEFLKKYPTDQRSFTVHVLLKQLDEKQAEIIQQSGPAGDGAAP